MTLIRHHIELDIDVQTAFSLARDYEIYAHYLHPASHEVRLIADENNQQLVEVSTVINNKKFSWKTLRTIDDESKTIMFEQIETSPFVTKMGGAWRFYPLSKGSLLSLEHQFEVDENYMKKSLPGIHTKEDAIRFACQVISKNVTEDFLKFKEDLPIILNNFSGNSK